jgi:glycosyltransferase involved in cell wall biosynthesis
MRGRVIVLSKYSINGASSRVRSFGMLGDEFHIEPFFTEDYITALYSGKRIFTHVIHAYIRRVFYLMRQSRGTHFHIEKEVFPGLNWNLFSLFVRSKGFTYSLDYDDATWHNNGKDTVYLNKYSWLWTRASLITCGNDYIMSHIGLFNSNVVYIPTSIPLSTKLSGVSCNCDKPTIVWIGTPKTEHYLRSVEEVLMRIQEKYGIDILLIGAKSDFLFRHKKIKWDKNNEYAQIAKGSIGIMPLSDDKFERGKCGYKLLQYLALGLFAVASPVGVNKKIAEECSSCFLAESVEEWMTALEAIIVNIEGNTFSKPNNGSEYVLANYNLLDWSGIYKTHLRKYGNIRSKS